MPSPLFAALIEALSGTYGEVPAKDIAAYLGVAPGTVDSWMAGKAKPNAKSIAKLLGMFVDHQASNLFNPLVEFSTIQPQWKKAAWGFSIEDEARLKPRLTGRKGVYIFYDSAGEATYLGKSASNLWKESRQRLNAEANRPFYGPEKGPSRRQGDIARFLSAYEVTVTAAIGNVETFMLRAFANDLMNRNSGKFKALLNGQPAKPPRSESAS